MTNIGTASHLPTLRILLTEAMALVLRGALSKLLANQPFAIVSPHAEGCTDGSPLDVDLAFVSRDVIGLSSKHELTPETVRFYETMRLASSLRWVHIHSAGADRPIYQDLMARGVTVTDSAGINAPVVAQTALAGLLALARRFVPLQAAQRQHRWAPLIQSGLPRDLCGQTAVVVGWGHIGKQVGALLNAVGLHVIAVRRHLDPEPSATETLVYAQLMTVLPRADWLVLTCPLTDLTRGLVSARALACLPPHAHLINVARGEVVDEDALIRALQSGRLAGAYLDVFEHEPLRPDSLFWDMPNVIVTPHSAGFSDGNAQRVERLFLEGLKQWLSDDRYRMLSA
jgi:D-2-hydroxyacid dehydrogenase (NADP+)